jgi:hypothetical protein
MLNSPGENALTKISDSPNSSAKYLPAQSNPAFPTGMLSFFSDGTLGCSSRNTKVTVREASS